MRARNLLTAVVVSLIAIIGMTFGLGKLHDELGLSNGMLVTVCLIIFPVVAPDFNTQI